MAQKRDYYEMLGVSRSASDGGAQEGLPQAGDEASSRSQPGRQGRRGALQGSLRSLPGPQRPRAPRAIRSLRSCRLRTGCRRRWLRFLGRRIRRHLQRHLRRLLRYDARARPQSRAARRGPALRPRDQASKKPSSVPRRSSTSRASRAARPAAAKAPRAAPHATTCAACRGSGQMRFQQGFFTIAKTCGQCSGQGTVIKDPCRSCSGIGRDAEDAGAQHQDPRRRRYRLAAQAARRRRRPDATAARPATSTSSSTSRSTRSSPPGERHRLRGADQLPASGAGCRDRRADPRGQGQDEDCRTAHSRARVLRLRGKGAPDLRGSGRGDQLVRVVVETPRKLTARQRELLEEFARSSGEEVNPLTKGFFDKVKEMFG